jgi:hypothetical protein
MGQIVDRAERPRLSKSDDSSGQARPDALKCDKVGLRCLGGAQERASKQQHRTRDRSRALAVLVAKAWNQSAAGRQGRIVETCESFAGGIDDADRLPTTERRNWSAT